MASTRQASFTLTRFESTLDNRIHLAGRWTGVEIDTLSQATLILHTPYSVHRLEAVSSTFDMNNWRAVFAWQGDLKWVERGELELGTRVVELPSDPTNLGRVRRFTATRLPVQELEQAGAVTDGPVEDDNVLALHAAMVAAQDEAAEARDERARLLAEARSAREQAKLEREQHESDVARLHDAMNNLRRLAEDSINKEREATRSVCLEANELEASVSTLQAEVARLREETEASASERAEVEEQLRLQQDEIKASRALQAQAERLSSELAHTRQELQTATEERNRLRSKFNALRDAIDQGE
jgi:chromosome segregation ATPase